MVNFLPVRDLKFHHPGGRSASATTLGRSSKAFAILRTTPMKLRSLQSFCRSVQCVGEEFLVFEGVNVAMTNSCTNPTKDQFPSWSSEARDFRGAGMSILEGCLRLNLAFICQFHSNSPKSTKPSIYHPWSMTKNWAHWVTHGSDCRRTNGSLTIAHLWTSETSSMKTRQGRSRRWLLHCGCFVSMASPCCNMLNMLQWFKHIWNRYKQIKQLKYAEVLAAQKVRQSDGVRCSQVKKTRLFEVSKTGQWTLLGAEDLWVIFMVDLCWSSRLEDVGRSVSKSFHNSTTAVCHTTVTTWHPHAAASALKESPSTSSPPC